ncbi:MAG: hypothetical protein JSS76_08295 [Bacteroidetes bacterium]|nr:hypothetical protein [Bacteroidota bacterium]
MHIYLSDHAIASIAGGGALFVAFIGIVRSMYVKDFEKQRKDRYNAR